MRFRVRYEIKVEADSEEDAEDVATNLQPDHDEPVEIWVEQLDGPYRSNWTE